MLFNEEIEGLNDDGFEGSLDERRIFNEVFFGNDSDTSSKKCLVTGVINFEKDHCKKTNVSFCSNSENSASTSQEGCLSEEFTLLTRNDPDMNVKRMKFSVSKPSNSKPYLKKDLSFATPLEGDVSHSTYRPVTCRLVESSSHGVTSSCYLLKRQMVDRDASKSKVSRVDGSGPKEVVASKAIASPVSQESYATKQLVAFPSVTDANKPCSLQLAKKRWKESCFLELDIAKMKMPRDSTTDPRPLLRYHINRLLRAAGWVIGRRKRAKYSNVSGEYVYRSPEGRPIREFRRAWNLCGQSLFADDANIVVEDSDCKQWTDLTQFCTDLANTLAEIKEQFDNLETTAALAHWWYLLDPFANVVFIDKTMGCLKAGNRVIAKRSLVIDSFAKCDGVLALKNVDSIGMDSALTVFEEGYGQVKALKGVSSHPSEGMYIHSVDTVNLTTSRKKSSSLDPCLLPACGSDSTCDQTCTYLFEVPITWENENIFLRRSETLSYHHDSDTSSLNLDNDGSENNADKTLRVIKDDHSNCTNDSFTESHDSERTNVQLNTCGNASQLWRPSLVEDSHLVDTEGGHCYETPIYLVDDSFFAADAMLKRKSYKKSKKIYEVELTTLYRSEEQGLSTSNKAGLQDIGGSSIQLESSGAQECSVANHRSNKNCKKLSLRSSQHRNHKKQPRCKKFLHNSCSSKKLLQVTNDSKNPKEFNFENTDKSPLNVKHESLDSQTWQCGIRSNKPETQDDGQKKLMTCHLKDDDLLISAIIKNKNFRSPTKRSSGERVSRKSKAQRKCRSQKGSCRLLPRSLNKGGKPCVEGKWSFFGTRTVLSWLINSGVVSLNEVILYRNPKDDAVVKDGLVTWDGILCRCCDKVLSVSEFKIHAGFRLNRPCLNLFLESGKPFTLCQLEAWSAEYKARRSATRTVQVEDMDQNDDSCGLCGDGGELICCDNCPSTFHQACMYAQELPEGSWYCPHCTCRICGDLAADEDSSQSPGALKCLQCEHKYHAACHEERFLQSGVASDSWFCGDSCQEVYSGLQSRIGLMNFMSDGFSWTLLRCIHGDQKVHSAQRFVALKAECNLKLAVALTIMEECFLPMVDPRTGIDMIPHVLYNWGSEFARLNYHGFQTVVLEKDDVLMSVASIRIHGVQVAEMPLIATCSKYRRQGMCRRLMKAIEELLQSFKVEKLVISAIPSLVETWTNGFGFTPLEDNEKKSLRTINLMVFPGTIWLKKPLYRHRVSSPQTGSDDPTETGTCSEGGPTTASDGNTPIKEVDAETERLKNTQICEDQDTCFVKQLTKPSCEEPASTTLERSQLDIVCHLESLQVYDDRKIPQLQKVSEEAASMFEMDKHEIACNLESIQVYDDRKLTLSQHSQETNVLHGK